MSIIVQKDATIYSVLYLCKLLYIFQVVPLPITRSALTFMGPCIVIIFQYISSKMQRYTVYLYLETALHVSGGTSTHHQKRKQLYLQHLLFVTRLLLSAAIVEELELV
jgi:hypothetical protein